MSNIWPSLIKIQNLFIDKLSVNGTEYIEPHLSKFNRNNWVNRVWKGPLFRRAHIDVVDARVDKGLWMMHCCIFPHLHNTGPIFGFDVIAGNKKITGCFHDFSPTTSLDHPMINWFAINNNGLTWKKERILPEWATNIFSPFMIAAGNVNEDVELDQILKISFDTIDYYLQNIKFYNNCTDSTLKQQNFYCANQKRNPHTPKVMASLGLDKNEVIEFVEHCLFPDVIQNN